MRSPTITRRRSSTTGVTMRILRADVLAGGTNLRVPGPTPLPPAVLTAQARQVMDHRSVPFHQLYGTLQERLQFALSTHQPCLLLPGGGTAAMDAAIGLCQPGDEVLVLSNGTFGRRFSEIATCLGLRPRMLQARDGEPFDLEAVVTFARLHPRARAVAVIAHETSTGMDNHAELLVPLLRSVLPEALLIVDMVSLAPCHRFQFDGLGIDAALVSSTKAMQGPPGLGIVALSERAQAVARSRRCNGTLTLSLGRALEFHSRAETPFTPTLGALYGLEAALELFKDEGRDAFLARHERTAQRVQARLEAAGMRIVAPAGHRAPTLTACRLPRGLTASHVTAECAALHGVVLSRGRDALAERVVRLAHMGYFSDNEIDEAVTALLNVVEHCNA